MLDTESFWRCIQSLEGKSVYTLTKFKRIEINRVDEQRLYIAGRTQPLIRHGERGLYDNYMAIHNKGILSENYWSAALPIILAAVPDEVEKFGSTLRLKPSLTFDKFSSHIESLKPNIELLLRMKPVTPETLPDSMPLKGVYLLSENNRHLYVGRSNDIRGRIGRHSKPGSTYRMAAFAFRLAREQTGNVKATYKKGDGSRSALMQNPLFVKAFSSAKERVSKMQLRFVEESDPVRQALLEIYAAVILETPYNSFNTT